MASNNPKEEHVLLSVIIVSFNTKELLLECVDRIASELENISSEIIVVDNNSDDASLQEVRSAYKDVKTVLLSKNHGFGFANNRGAEIAGGEFLLLLNTDAFVIGGSITDILAKMQSDETIAGTSAALFYPNGMKQTAGQSFPTLLTVLINAIRPGEWLRKHRRVGRILTSLLTTIRTERSIQSYFANFGNGESETLDYFDWVTAAALFIKTSVFRLVGGFDERIFMYSEDMDFCYRASQRGYRFSVDRSLIVEHRVAASSRGNKRMSRIKKRSMLYVYRKMYAPWQYVIVEKFISPLYRK